jgi:integrase
MHPASPVVIRSGGLSLTLWQVEGGRRWRWHYYRNGKRLTGSAVDLARAKIKARAYLAEMAKAPANASHRDASEFAEWVAARRTGQSFEEAAEAFTASLNATGASEEYRAKTESDLAAFTKHIGEGAKIAAVTPQQIEAWLSARNVGARRQNNLIATLASCFRHCRSRGELPDGLTAPERVARRKLPRKPIAVFSPEQLAAIFAACETEWRPAVAIQAFAGIRTAEVGRLYWRDVRPERGIIEIPAGAAKTGRRRLVPILPPLFDWLPDSPDPDEMVCPYEGHQVFIERLRRRNPNIKWITNGLRHSFGSYRCAVLRDIPAVAFEMGNSVQMVQAHYHEAQELATAREWFSVSPEKVFGVEPCKIAGRRAG